MTIIFQVNLTLIDNTLIIYLLIIFSLDLNYENQTNNRGRFHGISAESNDRFGYIHSNNNDTLEPSRLFKSSSHSNDALSAVFHNMDNTFQLCSWLCANPNVLQLANNMYQSMQTPLTADGSTSISPPFTFTSSRSQLTQAQDKVII